MDCQQNIQPTDGEDILESGLLGLESCVVAELIYNLLVECRQFIDLELTIGQEVGLELKVLVDQDLLLQVFTNTRKVKQSLDANLVQDRLVADARQL